MIGRNNSSLIGLVHVGRVIMIIFLTMSSCQRQVSCHKDGIEIIDILNKDCPIQIDLYDIVDSIKYIPLETSECLLSDIECIKNDGNFYFVKDSRGLFVFDEEISQELEECSEEDIRIVYDMVKALVKSLAKRKH